MIAMQLVSPNSENSVTFNVSEETVTNIRKLTKALALNEATSESYQFGELLKKMIAYFGVYEDRKGYHTVAIPKGVYGYISKVHEEVLEAVDASIQDNPIMMVVELSDIVGAIMGYLERKFEGKITFGDVVKQAEATRHAFNTGARNAKASD
jgi:phosphoribosyl-ATP pyrophosphohydrolase